MALTSEGTFNVSVVETLEAIEALRPDWERLLEEEPHPVINAHIDRYCSVVQAHGDSMRPHVIVLQDGGELRAIVVARLEQQAPKVNVGRMVSVGRPRRCLTVVHGGLLGCHDDPVRDAAVKALDGELRQGTADLAYLANVIGEGFLDAIRRQIPFHRRSLVPGRALHWRMTIPESLDAFYAQRSSKHRKHLRAYVRKLDKNEHGPVEMATYRTEEQVDRAVRDAAAISEKTYQRAIGAGFEDTRQKRMLLEAAARKGWFRGHILYVASQPVAYRFALCCNGTYFADGTGYDPAWRDYRVGTVLFLRVLEKMCAEGVRFYDFGFGDAEYKQHYADESWEDTTLYLFAPRLGPVGLNAACSVLAAGGIAGRKVLAACGWLPGLKRRWRRGLEKGSD